ncbi:hypothetical protein PS645_04049 [Pseudomonas fluorescens]|uniref:Uncharacterized protein n=1 Tax=Pseudomonas fluorescens TaxID=294 RepID=A0A5E6VFY6_PSEFL|nr:hypothetical protein PS645_04049 [Pseudomonas fluorescens]
MQRKCRTTVRFADRRDLIRSGQLGSAVVQFFAREMSSFPPRVIAWWVGSLGFVRIGLYALLKQYVVLSSGVFAVF